VLFAAQSEQPLPAWLATKMTTENKLKPRLVALPEFASMQLALRSKFEDPWDAARWCTTAGSDGRSPARLLENGCVALAFTRVQSLPTI
jgi:hypothetical protein